MKKDHAEETWPRNHLYASDPGDPGDPGENVKTVLLATATPRRATARGER